MGYKLHPGEGEGDERTSTTATLSAEGAGEVDYMAVVLFVFMLLDSDVSVAKLSDALDQVADLNPEKDTAIMVSSCGRARLAAGLVNAFLMKDSYERGLEE
jgi:hypothetical protein